MLYFVSFSIRQIDISVNASTTRSSRNWSIHVGCPQSWKFFSISYFFCSNISERTETKCPHFHLVTPSWLEILLISLVTHSVFSDQKTFYKFLVFGTFLLVLTLSLPSSFLTSVCHINKNFSLFLQHGWCVFQKLSELFEICSNKRTNERQMLIFPPSVKCGFGWSQIERLVKQDAKASSD